MIEFVSSKWIKPLWRKLRDIGNSREGELGRINANFGDPIQLSKYYIEPNCQHLNPADENEDDPVSTVRSPVFTTINHFLNGDFAINDDGRSQMFILADAGMGKSSLLVMLRLSYLLSFWPPNYACELLKLSEETLDAIDKIPNKRKTILLLDALDEDRLAWKKTKPRLLELLNKTTPFRRVIITCRTQFFPGDQIDPFKRLGRIKISGFICPLIFLSLFDDLQVLDYLKKRFPRNKVTIEKSKKIVTQMGSLRFRPLLLAYIDGFLDSKIKNWDETEIYWTLIETWLSREERKIRKSGRDVSTENLLKACCLCAALMQISERKEINLRTIELHVTKSKELSSIELLDIGGRSLINVNSEGHYRFSHYTIQEYLLAYGVVNDLFNKELTGGVAITVTEKLFYFIVSTFGDRNKKISHLNFVSVDFAKNPFVVEKFQNCTFTRINFSNFQISNTIFESCNFIECNMTGLEILYSKFGNCKFEKTPLDHVKIINSQIKKCIFNDLIKDVIFRNSSLTEIVYNKIIQQSTFQKTTLENINFDRAHMHIVSFLDCYINNSSIQNALFVGCLFDGGEFYKTNLDGSVGVHTRIENYTFKNTSTDNFIIKSGVVVNCIPKKIKNIVKT